MSLNDREIYSLIYYWLENKLVKFFWWATCQFLSNFLESKLIDQAILFPAIHFLEILSYVETLLQVISKELEIRYNK